MVTAVNLNPDLLRADRRSLFNACAKAASDGLLPDGRDGALVIFNTKDKSGGQDNWIKKVQWMPMVAGIIKKARQSGEISALGARIVYAEEIKQNRFTHKVVDGVPKVDHDPILWGDRGAMVLVYSFVRFKDGTVDFEFLHADDIKKMRAVSKAKFGPWFDWEEEMWKKSAIRRHAKRLPVSSELFDTIARDDEMTEFERQRREAETKMLVNARQQLGAPVGEIIEQGTEEPDDETEGDEPGEFEDADDLGIYISKMRDELFAAKTALEANAVDVTFRDAIGGMVERGELSDAKGTLQSWTDAVIKRADELKAKKK